MNLPKPLIFRDAKSAHDCALKLSKTLIKQFGKVEIEKDVSVNKLENDNGVVYYLIYQDVYVWAYSLKY